jgi:uroporphyrinogen decarboxylase
MNQREAFLHCMAGRPAPVRPLHLVPIWPDTLARWRREGLPADVKDVHAHLGVQGLRVRNVTPIAGLRPAFPERQLREDEESRWYTDGYGRTVRDFKHHTSMPEWVDFAVKTPADLQMVLDRHFDVSDLDARFDADWQRRVAAAAADPGSVVLIDGGCYYWTLRSLAGVEHASYLLCDAPELVDELFERYFTVVMEGLRRTAGRLRIDVLGFGEDVAFKTGTLMSPPMFRQLILPRYRAAVALARELGIGITWLDSDGDMRPLIKDLLSVGIDGLAPCEVAASMDPVALRAAYGPVLKLIGGVDKRLVAQGRAAIDAELARLRPVLEAGGFMPAIDHSVSSDISWDNYRYFLDALRRDGGMHA